MKQDAAPSAAELEAEIKLKRLFLRAALTIAGGVQSSPEATKIAGNEAARLKHEIAALESKSAPVAA